MGSAPVFLDTRHLDPNTPIDTTVCIIGAGIAGITIAMELDKHGIDVSLLESGGFHPDDGTRDLARGEDIGEWRYNFSDGSRSRFLGGSSNCWGGWCRPLDPWDFERRDWIDYSGWPFGLEELEPYYARTHKLLQLGPNNYDPDFWVRSIDRPDVRLMPLVTGKIRDTISQFSPPALFGKLYRDALTHSERIRVYLYANATNIDTDCGGTNVTRIEVATLEGKRAEVRAMLYVVATGGIENARLLLASNKVQANGLGNAYDLVGRFFMDHPRLFCGNIRFTREWSHNKLSDVKYHSRNAAVSAHGTCIAHQFALTPEVMQEERILNARIWFSSIFPGEGSAGAMALCHCKDAMLQREREDWSLGRDMMTMMAHPIDTLAFGCTRLYKPGWLIKGVQFQLIVEPEPNPNSRVTLSRTKKDALGMPRVQVDWRLTDKVKHTFDRTLFLLADDMRKSGVAEVELDPLFEGRPWPADFEGTWHHMGSTRMHESPKQGVVNSDCKVHGMSNLYIAGSSVFPTAGANFPTITLAALAFRLSEHLAEIVRNGDAEAMGVAACRHATAS
jgi:choline dehydrogenase-like flavoprotein